MDKIRTTRMDARWVTWGEVTRTLSSSMAGHRPVAMYTRMTRCHIAANTSRDHVKTHQRIPTCLAVPKAFENRVDILESSGDMVSMIMMILRMTTAVCRPWTWRTMRETASQWMHLLASIGTSSDGEDASHHSLERDQSHGAQTFWYRHRRPSSGAFSWLAKVPSRRMPWQRTLSFLRLTVYIIASHQRMATS